MTANYKSIKAVNNMLESLDSQNSALENYITFKRQDGIDKFYEQSTEFKKWFSIESNNITEPKEQSLVSSINSDYSKYLMLFSKLQEMANASDEKNNLNFYTSNIFPLYNELKINLRNVSSINEKAMFESKDTVTLKAKNFMYFAFTLSLLCVIVGSFLSRFYTNKFLAPIYSLTETIKSIKEGNLNKECSVLSNDEIGELALEFNKMLRRLHQYEATSKGKLWVEKNKSLAIVKSLSDPLIVLDTQYKILLVNEASEKFFNIKEDSCLNKYIFDAIRNGDLYDYISKSFSNNETANTSKIISFLSKDKVFYFNVVITLVNDKDSNINQIILLFQNVTQLKQVEKMKENFISTISHEFKTPLTSIMIGTSLMEDENIGILNDKQQKIIGSIKEDGEHLSELVTNMLHLSKIESDQSIFDINNYSIIGIIDNCLKVFYDQAEANDIHLYYEADENLPKVRVDSEKISWVINNLISNAFKYTNAGDEISINAFTKQNKMCVVVKDTGVGIPEEYKDKIFNKFTRIKDRDADLNGSGLGLAISKEIIEIHGGEIWCESELDVGSTFTFTLPLA